MLIDYLSPLQNKEVVIFAIILKSLDELGYAVEWNVINAADYGMPQRRRRVFILAYHKCTDIYKRINKIDKSKWVLDSGTLASAFPKISQKKDSNKEFQLDSDLVKLSKSFNVGGKISPFLNTGILLKGDILTVKTVPKYDGERIMLKNVLAKKGIPREFYIDKKDLDKWNYLKGSKKEVRKTSEGFEYNYSEGGMVFPDDLNKPSRTVITGEGGSSPSRFKHVIKTKKGLRRLTPLELERLNMFPDHHTELEGITDTKRAFFMGNALVVGVIEKIGNELYNQIQKKNK
jgi:DNA (cytosine-5)-methyltransferase 1